MIHRPNPSLRSVRHVSGHRRALSIALAAAIFAACSVQSSEPDEQPAADPPVHPAFSMRSDELANLVSNLPDPIADTILRRPYDFLDQLSTVLDLPEELTMRVDKETPLASDYRPDDLVSLADYHGKVRYAAADRMVRTIIVDDLLAMAGAAANNGVELLVQSAFRSHEYQQTLFANYAARHSEEAANRFSARAGESQHQLGTAVDFAPIGHQFTGTSDDMWLREHAWLFGFSLSYPQGYEELTGYIFEPWHYRYLGPATTQLEREFFDGIQHYLLGFLHAHRATLNGTRVEQ